MNPNGQNPVFPQQITSFRPEQFNCPSCRSTVTTKTKTKSGALTWAICGSICAAGLCFLIPWFGCQFIPFCVDDLKDVEHYCPNCNAFLGVKKKL